MNIPSPPGIATVTLTPQADNATQAPTSGIRGSQADTVRSAAIMKFAGDSHEYIREYIRNADQKAAFYFSICSALLAFEHTQDWAKRWISPPSHWSATDLISCISMVGLALASTCFLYVIMPRLGGSIRGLIFFKSVASFANADEYVSEVAERSEGDLASEKLRHCHELAKIASTKYDWLAIGLRIGGVAILCSLLLLVSMAPHNGIAS